MGNYSHSITSHKTWISEITTELTEGARDVHEAMAVQYGDARIGKECCKQQDSDGHHNNKTGVPVQQMLVLVVGADLHGCRSKQAPREEHLDSGSHPALKQAILLLPSVS